MKENLCRMDKNEEYSFLGLILQNDVLRMMLGRFEDVEDGLSHQIMSFQKT